MKKNYLFLLLLMTGYANAAIIYVNKNATGANNGSSWTNAYTTIEAAFANSIVGDKIWIAQGVYKPTGTTRSTTYNIPNGVEVYGSFAGTETNVNQRDFSNGPTTTLNGDINTVGVQTDNCWSVVKFTNVSSLTIFDGFKIINGYNNSSTYGGAIYNSGGQPTIRNCEMIANYATDGGAFGNATTEANVTTLINCKIRNNSATEGGAIFNQSGTLKLIDCDITSNTAGYGGAIHVEFDHVIIDRSIFSGNSASANGGVVYLDNTDSSIEFYNSLIVGNFAPEKSVMGMNSAVSNVNISKIIGCTIANNRNTGTNPNSSFIIVMPYNGGYFQNNIMTNNTSPRVLLNGYVSNCIIDQTIAANSTANLSTVAPTFVNPYNPAAAPFAHDDYDYRLATGSAGINGGSNGFIHALYTLDLDGNPRTYDTTVDIGAYEYNPSLSLVDVVAKNNISVYPNPSSGMLNFTNISEDFSFEIYSVTGAIVKKGIVTTANATLNVSELNPGVYIVKTSTNDVIRVVKK